MVLYCYFSFLPLKTMLHIASHVIFWYTKICDDRVAFCRTHQSSNMESRIRKKSFKRDFLNNISMCSFCKATYHFIGNTGIPHCCLDWSKESLGSLLPRLKQREKFRVITLLWSLKLVFCCSGSLNLFILNILLPMIVFWYLKFSSLEEIVKCRFEDNDPFFILSFVSVSSNKTIWAKKLVSQCNIL